MRTASGPPAHSFTVCDTPSPTELANANVSAYTLMKLLGHESMVTSQRYVDGTATDTRAVAELNPLYELLATDQWESRDPPIHLRRNKTRARSLILRQVNLYSIFGNVFDAQLCPVSVQLAARRPSAGTCADRRHWFSRDVDTSR